MSRISQPETGEIAQIARLASGGGGGSPLILVRMKELMKRGETLKKAIRVKASKDDDDEPVYEDTDPEKEVEVNATFTHGFYFPEDLVFVTRIGGNIEAVTNGYHKITGTLSAPMSSGGTGTITFKGESLTIEDDARAIPGGFTLSGRVHGVTVDDKLFLEVGSCAALTEIP